MQPSKDKYIEHLKSCAQLANDIANILGLRDDSAKQSCFATLVINADRYGVFMAPKDQNGPTRTNGHAKTQDQAAAEKADAQIAEIDPEPTPEKAEAANKAALIEGINEAVKLLNNMGHKPEVTPTGLNAYTKKEFKGKTLDQLDLDELETLTKYLCDKITKQKAKNAEKSDNETDVGF